MGEILFFTLGFMIGGLSGVILMCFMRINQLNECEYKIKKITGDKLENKKY